MITRLTLEGFGRFRRTVFELSPVTVLYGPNEAGKTTFFDGLFQALCRPGESKKAGRLLKERYGPGRKAEALFSDAGSRPITDDEFLNLYAIRAGDLRLESNQGNEWFGRLKARLFLGGVDPSSLAAEFEKRASDSRTLLHNKELDRAREDAAKAGRELEAHRREREGLLAREASLGDAEARLGEIRSSLSAAKEEAREVEAALAWEEKIAHKGRLSDQLARLEELEAAEAESLGPETWGERSREESDRLAKGTRAASEAVQSERGRRHALEETAQSVRAEWRTLREDMDASASAAVAAKRLSSEATDALARKKSGSFGLPWWSMAPVLAFLGAGFACVLLLAGKTAFATAVPAFLAAGAALILGLRKRRIEDSSREARSLTLWKAEWSRESHAIPGEAERKGPGEAGSVEGFLRFLQDWAAERKGLETRKAEARARLDAVEALLEKSGQSLASLLEEEARSRDAEQAWLTAHGTASREDFLVELSRRRYRLSDLPRRRREIEAAAQGVNLAAFRRDLVRRLNALDEEGVPDRGADEAGMQRLRHRRREILSAIEEMGMREREMIADREGMAGEIRGALGKMAAGIVACEERLAAAETRISAMELDKKAAAMAMDIFRELGDGADSLLEALTLEIGSMLARIIPREGNLSLPALDMRRIRAPDAGGAVRSLDHLSTGTKDSVVLAARLALALKHRGRDGILALDEPFLAMDEVREARALVLLQDFHARHGWQIILLTKEARLRDKAMAIFANPSLVDLTGCS